MSDTTITIAPTPDARTEWVARLEQVTEESGYFYNLGQRHYAFFADEGTTLLVTFETLSNVMATPDQLPAVHDFARKHGWSLLTIIADGETWYRDPAVYAFFDRQVDDCFFEDFDRVLFYGAGMGGYAACAFSVASPGAQVLALNPRASLAGREVCWDRRILSARRLDFTSRYGYAPEMLEGAGKVVVIHDLTLREEAMHSALFRAPWVTRLSAPLMGERIEWALRNMGVLPTLIEAAMAGKLTSALFATEWRKRRAFSPYLKALLEKAENAKRRGQAIAICRSVTQRLKAPHFARRLAKLTGEK